MTIQPLEPSRSSVRQMLEQISDTGTLDARGLLIRPEILEDILRAAPKLFDRPILVSACFDDTVFAGLTCFDGVTFDAGVSFSRACFRGDVSFAQAVFRPPLAVSFSSTVFEGDVSFSESMFLGGVDFRAGMFTRRSRFDAAIFGGTSSFSDAEFSHETSFDGAKFERAVDLDNVVFRGRVEANGTVFRKAASFRQCAMAKEAIFANAQFAEKADFTSALFQASVSLSGVRLQGDVSFSQARFERARSLGPMYSGGRVVFDDATFVEHVTIQLGAPAVSCRRTEWRGGVDLAARWAEITLEEADVGGASLIAAASPFDNGPEEEDLSLASNDRGFRLTEKPRLLSLRGTRVGRLGVASLDLSACRFEMAQNLEGLRIEGNTDFALTPLGWSWRRPWPPRRRWTCRRTVVEEHHWRAAQREELEATRCHSGRSVRSGQQGVPTITGLLGRFIGRLRSLRPARLARFGGVKIDRAETERPERWFSGRTRPPAWYEPRHAAHAPRPEDVALLYRALRKGFEDVKNEPGAADFYFGEMEMRRAAAPNFSAEKTILSLYWFFSGYGQRASRALSALLATIALVAMLLYFWGFDDRATSFSSALLFSTQSTTNLFRPPEEELTYIGELFEMTLRLLGPLFLGLALFSLRGHIKR